MNHYMVVNYNGTTTTFTPTPTIDAARVYLCSLLTRNADAVNNTMSIIDIETDQIIYYRSSNNSVESIMNLKRPSESLWQTLTQRIDHVWSQLNLSFAGR